MRNKVVVITLVIAVIIVMASTFLFISEKNKNKVLPTTEGEIINENTIVNDETIKNEIINENIIVNDETIKNEVMNENTIVNDETIKSLNVVSVNIETEAPYTINTNKYKIASDIKGWANPSNIELYKLLYDAVDQLKDEVDISSFTVNDEELLNLTNAIWNRYTTEFFYLQSFMPNEEKTKYIIKYSYEKEIITGMKEAFNSKVDYILNKVIKPNSSEFEKELAIYNYIRENTHYNYELDSTDCYSVIVNGTGICYGYSYTMKYLLDKVGIECYTVESDEISHMWNMVIIDGIYYHLDVTWDVGKKNLNYLNFTDAERKLTSSYKIWYGGNRNFDRNILPICNDSRYSFLRASSDYYISAGWVYYRNINDENKLYKVKTDGTNNVKLCDDEVKYVTATNMWIYYVNYANDNEYGFLYKIKKDGTEKTLVDSNVNINKISFNANELIYFDTITNSQITLTTIKPTIFQSSCLIKEYNIKISQRSKFILEFSENLDIFTINPENIYLLDSSYNILESKLEINNSIIEISPLTFLKSDEAYIIYITDGLTSETYSNFENGIILKFN